MSSFDEQFAAAYAAEQARHNNQETVSATADPSDQFGFDFVESFDAAYARVLAAGHKEQDGRLATDPIDEVSSSSTATTSELTRMQDLLPLYNFYHHFVNDKYIKSIIHKNGHVCLGEVLDDGTNNTIQETLGKTNRI